MYILNAFSANMLVGGFPACVKFTEVTAAKAADLAEGTVSAVGHADTAALFSKVLGVEVPPNRAMLPSTRATWPSWASTLAQGCPKGRPNCQQEPSNLGSSSKCHNKSPRKRAFSFLALEKARNENRITDRASDPLSGAQRQRKSKKPIAACSDRACA